MSGALPVALLPRCALRHSEQPGVVVGPVPSLVAGMSTEWRGSTYASDLNINGRWRRLSMLYASFVDTAGGWELSQRHAGRGAAEAEGAAGASSEGLAAVPFSQVCCSVTRFTCLCLAFAAPLFEPHMTEIYVQETFILGTSAHQVFGTRRVRRSHRLRIHRCRDTYMH